jgi:lipoprotein-anchoring transpeptidase ErfK/SrfK
MSDITRSTLLAVSFAVVAGTTIIVDAAQARPFGMLDIFNSPPPQGFAPSPLPQDSYFLPQNAPASSSSSVMVDDRDPNAERPARFTRQVVDYPTREAAGTIVIDTPNTYLYFVLGGGKAVRYGIGVGRDGFTWSGTQSITRKSEWPDWTPPAEMVARQPYLPRFMAGGPQNPLGARAMYLGSTIYRIHGTNAPGTIGGRVSSGCIRLVNEDVVDLYSRVNLGAKVVVLPISRGTSRMSSIH